MFLKKWNKNWGQIIYARGRCAFASFRYAPLRSPSANTAYAVRGSARPSPIFLLPLVAKTSHTLERCSQRPAPPPSRRKNLRRAYRTKRIKKTALRTTGAVMFGLGKITHHCLVAGRNEQQRLCGSSRLAQTRASRSRKKT
jgi:hypothetical protein